MSETPERIFERLCQFARETAHFESALELLQWDERTKMPTAAGTYRAEQITCLAVLIHGRHTAPILGDWLDELSGSDYLEDPHSDAGATIRQMRRDYTKRVRLPKQLVEELSRATTIGQQAWVEARRKNDFPAFAPHLRTILQLKREQTDALGFDECRYDALLDDFEPGARTSEVARVLSALRAELVPLVAEIGASKVRPNRQLLTRHYPAAAQEAFGMRGAALLGFDFQRGRLDVTHHPFCSGLCPNDCRITTRYDEHFFPSGFFGILHEAGHGMYEQGLRQDQFGLPPGKSISLGIHESQSRLWENLVGRSRPFWEFLYPDAQRAFPEALGDVPLDDFYFAINDVRPSLIRVEADEATYNLHIIARFELEQALIEEELTVDDLPEAWRQKYQEYLGIIPPDDAQGVLQDIHWSAGLFGYFPTYSLGNLYAAQFFDRARADLGDLDEQFRRGEFGPLRTWLTREIYELGQCYTAAELGQKVAGRPLEHAALMQQLRGTFAPLYQCS